MYCRSIALLHRSWRAMREGAKSQIDAIPEVQHFHALRKVLADDCLPSSPRAAMPLSEAMRIHPDAINPQRVDMALDAAFMTSLLHMESRVASALGEGFYTIGPGGEELMGVVGLVAEAGDPVALHYRHLAVQIARRLKEGHAPEEILLARARAFCVSSQDAVTGGAHCALGGGPNDFIVTSTLASQTCPAVGRALGGTLAHHIDVPVPFGKQFVSFVSLGDGSVNNGHYLSGENLAHFAAYRNHRVPLLTCVTDNGISISFKNHGYLQHAFAKKWQCKVFRARGDDVVDLWLRAHEAFSFVRSARKPAVLLVTDITRRFGHAATDRQGAYLTADDIKRRQSTCMLKALCGAVVESGLYTTEQLLTRLDALHGWTMDGFDAAHVEPKITSRAEVVARVSAPLSPLPEAYRQVPFVDDAKWGLSAAVPCVVHATVGTTGAAAQVMRKHMTKAFDDAMQAHKDVVYIGEDVQHGGYYMVTDGLEKKHPHRVQDFPPDETSLVGVGMGYRQSGLLPVVEIPYAKYLDCAMDMFTEACIMHWLSNGKQGNGMVFRLQGFGRGVFGGNYHTHNMLHMPPGLDVVCYSNGRDYSRGMRYALHQARSGRVSMFVDCTELLNMREVRRGVSWEMPYAPEGEVISFDDVMVYRGLSCGEVAQPLRKRTLVVSYGNGVPLSLQAQEILRLENVEVDVCDCPLLSSCPQGLHNLVATGLYDKVLFADVCKEGQHPLASHMSVLMNRGVVGTAETARVRGIAAPRTYNPLGNTLTFLNNDDIVSGIKAL